MDPSIRLTPSTLERVATGLPIDRLLCPVLDAMEHGIVLVDAVARLRYASALGEDELDRGDILQVRGGVVRAVESRRLSEFREALSGALLGRRRLLTFGTGASIAVTPIATADADDARHALLIFGKRPDRPDLSIDFFARSHALTGAEQAVLVHLARGVDPAGIAERQRVALSTIRSQIASIRAKTATASVRELRDRLALLPPIRPAVRAASRAPVLHAA